MRYYSPATKYVGLHFKEYDSFILNPVIKNAILNAEPKNEGHVSVYLPQYNDDIIIRHLERIKETPFHVFSKKVKNVSAKKNITVLPLDSEAFNQSIVNCTGTITGAGFETPAEILHLGKKLLCIPVKGQYEQKCNAAALKDFNVPVIEAIDTNFSQAVINWLQQPLPIKIEMKYSTAEIVSFVMQQADKLK